MRSLPGLRRGRLTAVGGRGIPTPTNLLAWFDPSTGLSDDGSTTTWVDRVNGHTVTETGSVRMTYSSSVSAFGGRPGLVGVAADNTRLRGGAELGAALSGNAAYTMYWVARANVTSAIKTIFAGNNSTTNSERFYDGINSAGTVIRFRQSVADGSVTRTGVNVSMGMPVVGSTVYASAASMKGYSNSNVDNDSSLSPSVTLDQVTIGASYGTSVLTPFDGEIGDIIIYSGEHDATTRKSIERWLATRYGYSRLSGIRGFTTSDYLMTANPGGIAGVDTGFWVAAMVRWDSTVSSAIRYFAANADTVAGWVLGTSGTPGTARFTCVSGAGSFITSPTYSIGANDIGKVVTVVAVHDGTYVRLYIDGTEVGSGTAIAGYTPANLATSIGMRNNATAPADGLTMFGVAGGNGVPSLAQIQAYYEDVQAAGRLVEMTGVQTDHIWNTTSVANIADEAGSDTMVLTGAPTSTQAIVPEWS